MFKVEDRLVLNEELEELEELSEPPLEEELSPEGEAELALEEEDELELDDDELPDDIATREPPPLDDEALTEEVVGITTATVVFN